MRPALFLIAFTMAAQTVHQQHPPQSADEYARILNNPERDAWQKPHEVITALAIRPDETVADIGSGAGYFSRRLARHARKVYAVDIDEKLLAIGADPGLPNLQSILAKPDDPMLPPNSVDTIFICEVLHHIEKRAAYYPKLAGALKPAGRIVIIDFYKKKLPVGPPEEMKISESQVVEELKSAGFTLTRKYDFLPYQYFLEFKRSAAS